MICLLFSRTRAFCLICFSLPAFAAAATCSAVIVNKNDCEISIDRESPASPTPSIRLVHGKKATVKVTRRPLETVVFSATRTDVAKADPLNLIVQNLISPLKALVLSTSIRGAAPAAAQPEGTPSAALKAKLDDIKSRQDKLEIPMNNLGDDFNIVNKEFVQFQNKSDDWDKAFFSKTRGELLCAIKSDSRTVTAVLRTNAETIACKSGKTFDSILSKLTDKEEGVGLRELPISEVKILDDLVSSAIKDAESITGLEDSLRKLLITISFNQSQLDDGLKALQSTQGTLLQVSGLLEKLDPKKPTEHDPCQEGERTCTYIVSEGPAVVQGLDRNLTLAVSTMDLVANKSNGALSQVTFTWRGTSWEASTGVLISTLPNRSFQNSPIIQNGQPVLDAGGKGTTAVTQSITRPTVIPLILAHYRLTESAPKGHRMAVHLTGGTGINPYSTSADFAAGLSVAFNSVMISPLLHFGRDTRLTNGLAVGEKFGSGPPTLTSERFWTAKFAIGITYTLPIP